MTLRNAILNAAVFCSLLAGCNKDRVSKIDCEQLKTGILANNTAQVKAQINALIQTLPFSQNTAANLNTLAESLTSRCGITAKVLCFNCIKTLPEQSEVRLSFSVSGSVIARTIDISYDRKNTMVFRNLHE